MIHFGKFKIINNEITACDYDYILNEINEVTKKNKSLLISPIASHTLVRAYYDKKLKKMLSNFDYLLPDSQWVKRSIWFLYNIRLKERIYGPDLMLKTCSLSEKKSYKVFLYGNTKKVLKRLKIELLKKFPGLEIGGEIESKFRELTENEWKEITDKLDKSQSNIIFISLGSPKQEIFSYKLSKLLKKPLVIIPVGAAFDFISKNKAQAPRVMQKIGLEWGFRLLSEPTRLLVRYFFYGVLFVFLIFSQKIGNFSYKE